MGWGRGGTWLVGSKLKRCRQSNRLGPWGPGWGEGGLWEGVVGGLGNRKGTATKRRGMKHRIFSNLWDCESCTPQVDLSLYIYIFEIGHVTGPPTPPRWSLICCHFPNQRQLRAIYILWCLWERRERCGQIPEGLICRPPPPSHVHVNMFPSTTCSLKQSKSIATSFPLILTAVHLSHYWILSCFMWFLCVEREREGGKQLIK